MPIERTPEQKAHLSMRRKEARERRKLRDPDQASAKEYKRSGRGYYSTWLGAIKQRAKEKGLPCDMDVDYLISICPARCPILGNEFIRRTGRSDNSPWAPTVDRIIPELGYVRGNVEVISKRANQIKSDATPEEIMTVALYCQNRT